MAREIGCERDEGYDDLPAQVIGFGDDGGFRDSGVFDKYALHFKRADAVTG